MNRRKLLKYLAPILALIASLVTVSIVVEVGGPNGTTTATIRLKTVKVDGPDADAKRDDKLVLTPAAQGVRKAAAAAPEKFDVGGDLRGKDPTKAGVLTGPLAAQEWPGCKTAFHNSFSSRGSHEPELIWFHFTAGPNIVGWADLDGLTAYSANTKNEVSWHFGVDREGHCVYNVPLRYKAWTEANANSTGIGIEMVGRGSELDYGGPLGRARLAKIVARIITIYPNIKLRLGGVSNCSPTRSGIVTHWMGGPCSGGHTDIRPYSIVTVIGQIEDLLKPPPPPAPSYSIVAWRPGGPVVKRTTKTPKLAVGNLTAKGYTRISVVIVQQR